MSRVWGIPRDAVEILGGVSNMLNRPLNFDVVPGGGFCAADVMAPFTCSCPNSRKAYTHTTFTVSSPFDQCHTYFHG